MWIRKKKLLKRIDELEEQLYLNYKKLNLTVVDARRQAHVFNALRARLHLDS